MLLVLLVLLVLLLVLVLVLVLLLLLLLLLLQGRGDRSAALNLSRRRLLVKGLLVLTAGRLEYLLRRGLVLDSKYSGRGLMRPPHSK